ncbi:MAG: hypothetical protein EBQ92_03520 [Proteobacteria bacterium]|nr:hypothetical protein [Pseudomonadota bacterium]
MSKNSVFTWLFFLSVSFGNAVHAAPTLEEKSTPLSAETPSGKFIGTLDIRPSDVFKDTDSFRMENSVSFGYRFPSQAKLIFQQELWSNLSSSPTLPGAPQGTLFARDGFFSLTTDQFWKSEDGAWFTIYEGRAYLPTFAARRDAGMVTAIRNYFTLGRKLTPWATLAVTETPVAHIFTNNAFNGKANPLFENRFQIKASFTLTSQLTLGLPLIWQSTKMRVSAGASKSGIWDNFIWINPELFYALDSNYTVGLAYYDLGGLTKNDLSDLQIMEGLRDGVVQFIFKASL